MCALFRTCFYFILTHFRLSHACCAACLFVCLFVCLYFCVFACIVVVIVVVVAGLLVCLFVCLFVGSGVAYVSEDESSFRLFEYLLTTCSLVCSP